MRVVKPLQATIFFGSIYIYSSSVLLLRLSPRRCNFSHANETTRCCIRCQVSFFIGTDNHSISTSGIRPCDQSSSLSVMISQTSSASLLLSHLKTDLFSAMFPSAIMKSHLMTVLESNEVATTIAVLFVLRPIIIIP